MKKGLLAIILTILVTSATFSQALYSSTAYTSRFNPGLGANGTPIVAYDDVSIPGTTGSEGDSISITKIKVGIRRAPFAPATNISIYYTIPGDEKAVDHHGADNIFLGQVSLPVNGSSLVTSVISLGDSANALFKIKKETGLGGDGYQKILIGASLDNPSAANGIVLTREGNQNLDSIWVLNPDTDKILYATSFGGQSPASYYLEVFGGSTADAAKEDRSTIAGVLQNDNNKAVTRR